MNIEWLAAALNPRDVAPHPNFMSGEALTTPGLLGLLAQLRWPDYERLLSESELALDATTVQMRLLGAVRKSLDADTIVDGAEDLTSIVTEETDDQAAALAGALFASVALADLDRHAEAVQVVERVLSNIPTSQVADEKFVRAIGLQQVAFRRAELGVDSDEQARESLKLLDGIRVSELSRFATSRGVRWRSSRTCSLIVAELRSVSNAHLVHLNRDPASRDWVRLVRAPAPELDLLARRSAGSALSSYVKEAFEAHTKSNTRTFFSGDPVEDGVYEALLHYELLGAGPQSRTWRAELGRLRILRRSAPDHAWSAQDGIRLLRQAEDLKSLDPALRHVRAGGPLVALAGDARQIIETRVAPTRLRKAEFRVLEASAHLLTQDAASTALSGVLEAMTHQRPSLTRGWEAPSVGLEAAWSAAVELAGPADRLDEVALALLDAARLANRQDELLTRALTRAAMDVEWDGVTEETRSAWLEWLEDPNSQTPPTMIDSIGPEVGLAMPAGAPDSRPIERAATLLNNYFRTGTAAATEQLGDSPSAVERRLREIRQEASKGRYSVWAISAPDVAAGLALHFGVDQLWQPLIELILDQRVAREDKAAPLERLARSDTALPAGVIRQLGEGIAHLLSSSHIDPFRGQALTPFPAALRLAAAHSLLSDERILAEVARLGGSHGTEGRVEAARTLALLSRIGQDADWITAMTLQLSHDQDPLVRGETGRGLGALARHSRRHADLIDQRLLDLLGEDGLVVPILVLRGLQADGAPEGLPSAVAKRVALVAESHPAWGVRLQAQALVRPAAQSTSQ